MRVTFTLFVQTIRANRVYILMIFAIMLVWGQVGAWKAGADGLGHLSRLYRDFVFFGTILSVIYMLMIRGEVLSYVYSHVVWRHPRPKLRMLPVLLRMALDSALIGVVIQVLSRLALGVREPAMILSQAIEFGLLTAAIGTAFCGWRLNENRSEFKRQRHLYGGMSNKRDYSDWN